MKPLEVSVPGKMLLLGEYAVLEQGRAISAAVDRRAIGRRTRGRAPESPVVSAVRDRVEAELGSCNFGIDIDTRAFRSIEGTKLGIGSSSAAAVAAAALLAGRTGDDVCDWAIEGHRDAAEGRGSGVDVLTCYLGGVVAALRQPGLHDKLSTAWPGYDLHVVFLGSAASTPDMVRRCKAAPDWVERAGRMRQLAEDGVSALGNEDGDAFVRVVRAYSGELDALGQSAAAPVVTEDMRAIIRAIETLGGAAKGSGAGGGDVMVLWLPEGQDVPALPADARRIGLAVDFDGLTVNDAPD